MDKKLLNKLNQESLKLFPQLDKEFNFEYRIELESIGTCSIYLYHPYLNCSCGSSPTTYGRLIRVEDLDVLNKWILKEE